MARVVLERVTKVYPGGAAPAVEGVCLDVGDREFVVLVGPSGCGKSTTLRMVAGLEAVTEGVIRIGERVVNDVPPAERDLAMVFQNYALYPHLTVFENMAFGLTMRRRRLGLTREAIRSRVEEAARSLGMTEHLGRLPGALSGGQRQRVALGRAIVRKPLAFLLDEPLSSLDAKLRVEMRGELKRLHQRLRTTTLYVTHDQEEAMTLGDRVVVMRAGEIQQCAPPLEVYERPANRFVAGFVGVPGMNFVEGRVEAREGGDTGPVFRFRGGGSVSLEGILAEAAVRYVGRELVMGIRPEGLRPVVEGEIAGAGGENIVKAKVVLVEPLGDRMDIVAVVEGGGEGAVAVGGGLVCRTEARTFGKVRVGGIIMFLVDPGRVHLFESGDQGVNITLTRKTSHAAA